MALSAVGRKLLITHGTQKRIARQLGVMESEVSKALAAADPNDFPKTERGWKRRNRIQRAIAKALGISFEEAFSDEERGVTQDSEVAA